MKRIKTIDFKAAVVLFAGAMLLGAAGCTKNDDGGNAPGGNENKLPVFDFSTQATYSLNVQYAVPQGYQVYFEVYSENPLATDANGSQVKKAGLEPLDKGYTDESGKYVHSITVPASIEKLYVYTPDAGIPQLLTADVQGGVLSPAALTAGTAEGKSKAAATKTLVSGGDYDYPGIGTVLLGTWSHSDTKVSVPGLDNNVLWGGKARIWGRPDYLSYVEQSSFPDATKSAAMKISAGIWKTINTVLPGDGMGKVSDDVLKSGDIHVKENAEIDLYLLDEQCLYRNVLAYYCYPTGQAPASPSDIKYQAIALPDAKIIRSHAWGDHFGDIGEYGAMLPGEGIRLHYIDENGVDQGTTFPAGTSIGWILYSDGYKNSYTSTPSFAEVGKLTTGEGAIYSDPKLMNGIPHVAVFRHGDFVVTGFEDGKKTNASDARDYKDVVFHVASTPSGAITDGVPDKDPDQPKSYDVTYRGILSFEDNWPYRGDFDMNDVVVKYVSTVTYTNQNQVAGAIDQFTILWSGAKYNNDFAYENLNIAKGSPAITLADEAAKSTTIDNANGILRVASGVLDFANESDKRTYTIKYDYKNAQDKDGFVLPPYNPFITVKGDQGREVHLTNRKPTSFADPKWFGYGHDESKPGQGLYYITYDENDNQMPFAINVAFDSEQAQNGYVIPAETKHISTYYPGFMQWLKSGGTTNKDWYLKPKQ